MSFKILCSNNPVCTEESSLVTLEEINGPTGDYTIYLNGNRNICRFSQPIQYNTTINLTVNSPNANIGDQLVLLFAKASNSFVTTINFPDNLFVTFCGERSSDIRMPQSIGTNYTRVAQIFTFDGDYWVSSGDNC